MKTENELFELIKDNYSLNPRKEFVSSTENKIRQIARNLDRKRKFKNLSVIATSITLSFMAISWIFFLGGHETINVAISAAGQNKLVPAVSQQGPLVYIYHSHNRESFRPELNSKDAAEPFDESKNITLVGNRLKNSLIEKNINTIHEDTDFATILEEKGLFEKDSYLLSRESLKKALMKNENLEIVIDIHRDTLPRKDNTIVLDGKEHAKIALYLSRESKYHKENSAFAEAIQKKMEQRYPGLSRGVILKDSAPVSVNYNQDLIGESVLMTIGGVDSTLEEEYRTADILAEIIEEIIEKD